MGCNSSKNVQTQQGQDPSSATTSSKPPPPTGVVEHVERVVSGALEALHEGNTSVMDQISLAKQMVVKTKSTIQTKARNLQIIFATPLEFLDSATYQPPSFPKTTEESDFIRNAILQNFVFANINESQLKTMILAFEQVSFPQNATVIQQGDVGDYFYVIRHGAVQFLKNNKAIPGQTEPATSGQTFGELALLYHAPRAATCIVSSEEPAILYRVDQKTFRYILQTQTQHADKIKRDLLRGIPFLKELDDSDLGKLADNMTPRPFNKGDVLVKKGDIGDAFYVIREGKVAVRDIEVGGKACEDMVLGPGDFFGERALVTQEPRMANCIASTPGIALCVDRDTFSKVMGNMQNLVLKATDKRLLEALKVFQTTPLDPSDFSSLAELIVDIPFEKGQVVFQEGHRTSSAFYIIREGQVRLTSTASAEYNDKILKKGGFFGEDMLQHDALPGVDLTSQPTSKAKYTVTVLEDCTLGLLTLDECRTVFDTTKIGKALRSNRFESIRDSDIQFKSLKRHAILGAGTFGQVWLVSRLTSDGRTRKAYALKIQSKYELIRHSQAMGVVQEKNIMAQLRHPFIINLVTTFQDPQRVYMLLGLVQGGELFSVMHKSSGDGLSEANAQFYSAGVLEGLAYMHRRHILYRDLKPENVLVDETGYPVIVDLGFAKYVKEKTYTLCGTPLYIAPEVVLNRGHDKGADHWSLACMIYEMICGLTPFYKDGMDQLSLFRAIVKGHFKFPKSRTVSFSEPCKDLVTRMLVTDPFQRLGSLAKGEKDIFRAAWFADINFEKLKRKELPAPWVPNIKDPLDTSNFENWDHLDDKAKAKDPPISKKEDEIFQTF